VRQRTASLARRVFNQKLYAAILAAPSDASAHKPAEDIVAEGVKDKLVDQNEAKSLARDDTRLVSVFPRL